MFPEVLGVFTGVAAVGRSAEESGRAVGFGRASEPAVQDVAAMTITARATNEISESIDVIGAARRRACWPGRTRASSLSAASRWGATSSPERVTLASVGLVRKADFPEFVSGLIHGVFQAIVDASVYGWLT